MPSLNGSGIGAGVYNWSELGATFNFQNTIIANNQVGSNPNNIRDCAGVLFSQGYNLIRITPAGECIVAPVTGDVFSSIPFSVRCKTRAGRPETHALLAGSPAIDAGNPSGCDRISARCWRPTSGVFCGQPMAMAMARPGATSAHTRLKRSRDRRPLCFNNMRIS